MTQSQNPPPAVTLEQARTLVAVAQHGSFAKAAKALHKVPSAVVYSLKVLEDAVGLPVFDRTQYRSSLTPLGSRILEHCQRLLDAASDLDALCRVAQAGADPYLKVVFDGLLPVSPILAAARQVGVESPVTRISLYSEFLGDVEARFEAEEADVMISVVPLSPRVSGLIRSSIPLAPLPSLLVVSKDHPLALQRGPLSLPALERHTFLTVRGSDERLQLATAPLEKSTVFRLSDFHAKKAALLDGMGYGWMPEYLIESEIVKRRLRIVPLAANGGRHVFKPVLHRRGRGPASDLFLNELASSRSL